MGRRNKTKQQTVKPQLPADMYSYGEAAKLLRLSARTLQHHVKSGALHCTRVRQRVYFTEAQLLDFVESCKQEARNVT